jgi:ABC-type lipoprotein export system ATPase subunit
MIELRNVEKSFQHGPHRTFVLRQINLSIAEGEFVSIMGPSGAGKSTLLHVLGLYDSEWTGEYRFLPSKGREGTHESGKDAARALRFAGEVMEPLEIHKLTRKQRQEVYKR